MLRFLSSQGWCCALWYRSLRIYVLSIMGYFFIFPVVGFSQAMESEWPHTDFSRHRVDMDEIISGGPAKDGIPAIDSPKFVTWRSAAKWLDDREPVIVVELGNAVRAYPLQILMFHEIVNDRLAGVPISVTFCPLCNASIVFERRIGDVTLDFGTTGKLRKSDLIMYDRQSESWWQQFTGAGIVGEYAGAELVQLASSIVAFKAVRVNFPKVEVLSRDTGFSRPYGNNPYRGYDDINDSPFLYNGKTDPRLPPMERVIGVTLNKESKIYPFSAIEAAPVINDQFQTTPIVVFSTPDMLSVLDDKIIKNARVIPAAKVYHRNVDGRTLTFRSAANNSIRDDQTQSTWNIFGQAISGELNGKRLTPVDSGVHFAFAWLAFRPHSVIYQ